MPPTERRPTQDAEMSLPELTPFQGDRMQAGDDHVAVDFVDLDFAAQVGLEVRAR